jgi:hypothetical protein
MTATPKRWVLDSLAAINSALLSPASSCEVVAKHENGKPFRTSTAEFQRMMMLSGGALRNRPKRGAKYWA